MNFFRTSFLASISTGVGFLCGMITTKYVAKAVGPDGLAFVGQFSNTISIFAVLSTAACTAGVIKYLAQYKASKDKRQLFASAFVMITICAVILSIIAIVFSKTLSLQAFKTDTFWKVFAIYGLLLIFSAFNQLGNSVLNGEGQIKKMTLINAFNAIFNIGSVIVMAHYFGLSGILLASSVTAVFSFFQYFYHIKRLPWIHNFKKVVFQPDQTQIKLLLGFTAMNLTSGLLAPAIQLAIRSRIITKVDVTGAGIWQATMKLSDLYMGFVYTVLGVYYLPKLSQLQGVAEIKKEIRLGYIRLLPAIAIVSCGIIFFQELIIKTFLTADFLPMVKLIKWQLLGDFLKIASWLVAYLMAAKAMKKTFIATEIIFSALYVVLSVISVQHFGVLGPVYAFVVNYFIYTVVMLIIMRKYVF